MACLLVAEDSRTQAERVRSDLEAAGHQVTLAPNGAAAWEIFDAEPFDLVLSDVVMPGINGYELCRRVKQRDASVPVMLVTSLSDPLDVVHGLQAGADNFLRKPYETEQLLGRIETMLANRRLRREGEPETGLELFFLNRRFVISAERPQILDLLLSTFEDLVETNEQLRRREEDLRAAHQELALRVDELEGERRRLRGVLASVPNPMVIVDRDGTVTDASDACSGLLGGSQIADLAGRPVEEVVPLVSAAGEAVARDKLPLLRCMADGTAVEAGTSFDLAAVVPDGSRVPVIARAAPIRQRNGEVAGAVGLFYELGGLAAHDPLTKLPTQALLVDRVRTAAAHSAAEGRISAVAALVIDRIDAMRADLGHQGTEEVVLTVSRRLQDFLGEPELSEVAAGACLAYLGNQEFAVVLPGLAGEIDAVRLAGAMVQSVNSVVSVSGIDVTITPNVGVAFPRQPSPDPAEVVRAAVAAAHDARRRGGGHIHLADPDVQQRAADRLRREADLRRAISNGELVVHYQPQLAVATGAVAGVEALVRWQRPDGELVSPAAFLPLAEETGLIVGLGWEVLQQAARQAAEWRRTLEGARHLAVSVNLSSQQLADPDIADRLSSVLAQTGLAAEALVLEITESGVMEDGELAACRLRSLKTLGVRLSIDDFGTGYSSLVQLRQFPVDDLKIDRQFVAGMTADEADAAIVAGSVGLGRALGLKVVAEGVETTEQLSGLRVLGCDYGQGYHWSKPVAARDFEHWWTGGFRSVVDNHRAQ